jgi:hypothetical protein
MSEQPTPYGDVPPVPAPIIARVDAVEHQIAQNANAIAALVNAVDHMRSSFDGRLAAIESQLAALNENNKLLAELIITRLPDPKQ